MRILKVVQAYYPFEEKGGPVVKVRALAHGLARRGNRVTVLTPDLGIEKKPDFSKAVHLCEWGWRWQEGGVETIYLTTIGNYRALTISRGLLRFGGTCLEQFDLVHFYGLYDLFGPVLSYYCRQKRIPYVIEPMGMYRPIDRNQRLKRVWHRSVGKVFCANAALMVATSEIEQQELLNDGIPATRVTMRYNGIAPDLFSSSPSANTFRRKWGVPLGEPMVLFLSRLIPRKGADVLIESFAQVSRGYGRLVIAGPEGESGYRAYLEERARQSGIEKQTVFTGPLYGDEKKAAFTDSDVFALPSRYENFANAAAEAMAFGIPVIVSEFCGIRSLVSDRSGIVITPEKAALVDALRKLLYDKTLYANLKEGCRRVAAELDWDRLTEQMERHYAEALYRGTRV